jgi:hypothetical protein
VPKQSEHEDFPEIQVNDRQLRHVSGDCLDALKRSNEPPYLFARAGLPLTFGLMRMATLDRHSDI